MRCWRCPPSEFAPCDHYFHCKRLSGLIGGGGTVSTLTEEEQWLVGLLPQWQPTQLDRLLAADAVRNEDYLARTRGIRYTVQVAGQTLELTV